jgi:hypothetical protein
MLKKVGGLLVCAVVTGSVLAAPEAIPRQVFSSYWSVLEGHESTFQLHNNLLHERLRVRPVLLAPTGTRTELPLVEIAPLERAAVSVGAALAQLNAASAGLGSAVFEYSSSYEGALSVETVMSLGGTPLADIAASEHGASASDLHAIYRLSGGRGTGAYIALQNVSASQINISASIENASTDQSPFASVRLGPNESRVITVPPPAAEPLRGGADREPYAAIRLTHDGPEGSLNAWGWIENNATGYSSAAPFYDPGRHKGTELVGT